MEVNNHVAHLPHKDMPTASELLYMRTGAVPVVGTAAPCGADGDVQGQLMNIEKYYQLQEESLIAQFEEKRKILAQEQQLKMQEHIKVLMIQKQQQEVYEQQKKLHQRHLEAERERLEHEKLLLLKNKNKDEQSAVASNEVKLKLRECLLNKGHREVSHQMKNSPPEFRQWATQHSSLEQHSPPMSGLSPPLRAAHLIGRLGSEYPLRKTASEPNMKVRFALKQKMMERRSTIFSRRKDRFMHASKRSATTPLTVDTTVCNNSSDSGPNSPHSGSIGQPEAMTPQKEEIAIPKAFPLQLMSKMVINQSMPNISIGQPREPTSNPVIEATVSELSAGSSEAELRARAAIQHGLPLTQHMLTGPLPMYPPMSELALTNAAYVEAHLKARSELAARSMSHVGGPLAGQMPVSPTALALSGANMAAITDAQAAHARLGRPLNRTQSAPLPLPGQLLWSQQQQQLLMQQQLMKENQKHYLKQRLHSALAQRSASKNHMENVDEEAEARLAQEMREMKERDDEDVVIISDKDDVMPHRSQLADSAICLSTQPPPSRRPLERAKSSPLVTAGLMSVGAAAAAGAAQFTTGLAYDPMMLKHQCLCGNNAAHPEHPGRLQSIYARLLETGLVSRCGKGKSRKASLDELQTCHSEVYTLMYGTSPQKLNPKLFEALQPRFSSLPCGGIGVDSDTVWNDAYTPQATRMAVGCVVELAFSVAMGEFHNGLALVRPPGHHAEPTQAMGFCYFNSLAIAAKLLLERLQLRRILIVDWDVHHGNSTQQIFYADPRVLYISLHRHDAGNFFPGTGGAAECGIEKGRGFNVNIAFSGQLQPPMGDAEYVAAFRTIVMPIAREFNPEIVLVSAGFDAAVGHPPPLGGYEVTPECFGHLTKQLMTLANGRVVLALEGGYNLQSICDSSEMCLRALLGDEIALLKREEMCRRPSPTCVDDLRTTIGHQATYWPCLARYGHTLSWSIVAAQQGERETTDTMNAFASLSVVPEKPVQTEAETRSYDTIEPMEEA